MTYDTLLDCYLHVLEKGISQEAIAKASGINVNSLRKFKQGESMGEERREKLHSYLLREGYYESARKSDPALFLAKELRHLADTLESTIDLETKRVRFASFIDDYGSGKLIGASEKASDGSF